MKEIRKYLFIALCVFSCDSTRSLKEVESEFKYELTGEYITDFITRLPGQLAYMEGNLIVTHPLASEYFIEVFEGHNWEKKYQLAKRGKGPGEFLYAEIVDINPSKSTLYLFDFYLKRFSEIKLSLANSDLEYKIVSEISLTWKDFDNQPFTQVQRGMKMNDNSFITIGEYPKMFALFNKNGEFNSFLNDYPINEEIENWEALNASFKKHPKKDLIFYAAKRFGYLACFEYKHGDVKLVWEQNLSEPVFQVRNNRIVFDEKENLQGFFSLQVTEKRVYALYQGRPVNETRGLKAEAAPDKLLVYSTDGSLLGKYVLNPRVLQFCLNEDETLLYAISSDFKLYKFELNGGK